LANKSTTIFSKGVLYGYGSREELKEAGADCIVEDVQSLLDVLKKGGS